MRVISGKVKGLKLESISNISTRPTLDRVKESLFNILQNDIKDKIILDLFAGSGALGIEALSRGAKYSYFCDSNLDCIKKINSNLKKAKLEELAFVKKDDYVNFLKNLKAKIDIIFLDPPYSLEYISKSLENILKYKILNDDGIIIIESDDLEKKKEEIEKFKELKIIDNRKYGRANLIFIKEEK